jgi:hypothetical protein
LASNFSDRPEGLTLEPLVPSADDRGSAAPMSPSPTSPVPIPAESPTPAAPQAPAEPSAAIVRFRSCRWYQPPENGNAEFCTHREVKPYAGTTGFDADAWCPDCQYYKLRRAPKKRERNDDYMY